MSKPLRGEIHEHPVLDEVREHWFKIAGILAWKLKKLTGEDPVTITSAEINEFADQFGGEQPAVVYAPKGDPIRLWVLPQSEAQKKTMQ